MAGLCPLSSYMTQCTLLLVRNRLATRPLKHNCTAHLIGCLKKRDGDDPSIFLKSSDVINPHRSKDICHCVIMRGMTIISRKVKSYTQIKWNSLPYDIHSLSFITIDICTNGRDTQYANHPIHPREVG